MLGVVLGAYLAICLGPPSALAAGEEPSEFPVSAFALAKPERFEPGGELSPAESAAQPEYLSDELEDEANDAVFRASFWQPQPPLAPQVGADSNTQQPRTPIELRFNRSLLGASSPAVGGRPASSLILGLEAMPRASSDAADLLRKSPAAIGVETQRRTPIVNDPRLRGGRVGLLSASGSHWIPARIDLDTAPSKIDSRAIEEIITVKGPYSSRYGPGFQFMEFDFLRSPRFDDPTSVTGSTSIEYQTNGSRWYGRQSLEGGDDNQGWRLNYGHRTGNDYLAGDGATRIPASYNSRDLEFTYGFDLDDDSSVEINYLRLDQTNLEFSGQAFDIDYLITDGVEVAYRTRSQPGVDEFFAEGWYNQTTFAGNAQNPSKRGQFPFFDFINFQANTNVRTISTGYTFAGTWGDASDSFTAGTDLRVITQRLDEIASGRLGQLIFTDVNSPIPRSQSVNPGFFFERKRNWDDRLTLSLGGRADYQHSDLLDPNAGAQLIGPQQLPLADVYGRNDFAADFGLWQLYVTGEYAIDDDWTLIGGIGHGERPPSLTELYVAQSFMFLLQNGANTVTGDPNLAPERVTQFDLGLRYERDKLRLGANSYFAFANDYITFENLGIVASPAQIEQVQLQYVNTPLATFTGLELHGEYDATDWLQPFATLNWVEGIDRTRNGNFATLQASPGNPTVRVDGLPRGFFSGVGGGAWEPLPGIYPLNCRIGARIHPEGDEKPWEIEFAARIVDQQTLVATSLLEQRTPGFTVLDVRGYWRYSPNLLFIAGVENFGDRFYREHLDFRSQNGLQATYQPGASLYLASELSY